MSINSLKSGFTNTTPRTLEACCEHTVARNAAYPTLLVPSHGHGGVHILWAKDLYGGC